MATSPANSYVESKLDESSTDRLIFCLPSVDGSGTKKPGLHTGNDTRDVCRSLDLFSKCSFLGIYRLPLRLNYVLRRREGHN